MTMDAHAQDQRDDLPSDWKVERLGDSCRIKTGKKDVNEESPSGKYPFFTCSKEIHYSDTYSFDTEAILVAGNGAVGETKYYQGKFEAYQRTYVLDQFSGFAPYVFLFLKGTLVTELARHVTGSTMPYIRKGDLENIEIPAPPHR
jgi:type I restriction enzyme S subunit